MARHNELTIEDRALIASKQKRLRKLVPIALSILGILIFMLFTVSFMYTRFGSFSVRISKQDQLNYGIVLSETKDFAQPTAYLNCRADEEITNIDGKILDDIDLGAIDGVDNGTNYICYTFYLKNSGNKTLDYNNQIIITNMTLGIEKAVRIRVITKYNDNDAVTIDYARAAGVDEAGNQIPEDGTTAFYSKNTVLNYDTVTFNPGDVMKYTIVIWLEGPDKDCTDDILGGEFKIDMDFSIKGYSEVEE